MNILDKINKPNDIKKLSVEELEQLPAEIRQFLLLHVSKTGGHLASNLGAVELTIALHRMLDFPKDKLVWDVGHQSYVHKILTGRKDAFDTLRQIDGLSGFPKREESDCDCFDTGHSSTSISAGLGIAQARDLQGEDYTVVSVIGDGSFTGGLAYEALNNATQLKSNFIIVLNDNEMSISKNVGGFSSHLASIRMADRYQGLKSGVHHSLEKMPNGEHMTRKIRRTKNSLKQLLIPGMIFENMGVTYLGPVNGHNLSDLMRVLSAAKKVKGPVVVHVNTKKGKGYRPAENNPARFHGTGPFRLEDGMPVKPKTKVDYTNVFSTVLCNIAKKDPRVVAITAAMADGTGLLPFSKQFPERFFDVGIAEGHAVTFAAGLASAGMKPVFAVYSSFLQRGIDELITDVCLQKLPVVFAIDRAGLVGADGETHQGIFDLSYLSAMPGMTVLSPKNAWELADMLRFAVQYEDGPIAIRYPRGSAYDGFKEHRAPIEYGKSELLCEGKEITLVAEGTMLKEAEKACALLREDGYDPTLLNIRFIKPLDQEMIESLSRKTKLFVTMEDNIRRGGLGDAVLYCLDHIGCALPVLKIGIDDCFVPHGSVDELHKRLGMDAESVAAKVREEYQKITSKDGSR
jgi:1-deoxy-D-xylulose-5-phosphate synthase